VVFSWRWLTHLTGIWQLNFARWSLSKGGFCSEVVIIRRWKPIKINPDSQQYLLSWCTQQKHDWNCVHSLLRSVSIKFKKKIFFIKALQHKCWRSVGHQVLQPTKDVKLWTVCLKSFRQEKKSMMHQDSISIGVLDWWFSKQYIATCIWYHLIRQI